MKLATLCYLKQDGRTLMIHRIKKANDMHQGKWNGLGGKFEAGETPEDAPPRNLRRIGAVRQPAGVEKLPHLSGFRAMTRIGTRLLFVVPEFSGELIEFG